MVLIRDSSIAYICTAIEYLAYFSHVEYWSPNIITKIVSAAL